MAEYNPDDLIGRTFLLHPPPPPPPPPTFSPMGTTVTHSKVLQLMVEENGSTPGKKIHRSMSRM